MKEREKERKRCSYYFGSEQTPNDASIPAAVNEKQQRGKTGERTSFHAGKVVIILISPCLNLNRGPKLEFAAQTWDPHVCVCVCVSAMDVSHVSYYPQVESLLCKNLFTPGCVCTSRAPCLLVNKHACLSGAALSITAKMSQVIKKKIR